MSEIHKLQFYERIHSQRASLSPNQERIARFVLDHPLDTALLTATELAQQLDVDPATVVRFAQKLGYRGYLELKTNLGQLVRGEEPESPSPTGSLGQALEIAHESLSSEFNTLWVSLDGAGLIQLAELLGTSCHLLLLSDEICSDIAGWLADVLRNMGYRIDHPSGDPEALAKSMLALDNYDRTLILEGTTQSLTLEHLAQDLQRKEIRSLAIVGSTSSQVALYVDAVLQLQALRDPALYPVMVQQLFMTILHAVRIRQEALRSADTLDGDPQEGFDQGANAL
jgi:DNA-binding MurR/RpiR family transcriptional regulator